MCIVFTVVCFKEGGRHELALDQPKGTSQPSEMRACTSGKFVANGNLLRRIFLGLGAV